MLSLASMSVIFTLVLVKRRSFYTLKEVRKGSVLRIAIRKMLCTNDTENALLEFNEAICIL